MIASENRGSIYLGIGIKLKCGTISVKSRVEQVKERILLICNSWRILKTVLHDYNTASIETTKKSCTIGLDLFQFDN
jgi:hypothetical protein